MSSSHAIPPSTSINLDDGLAEERPHLTFRTYSPGDLFDFQEAYDDFSMEIIDHLDPPFLDDEVRIVVSDDDIWEKFLSMGLPNTSSPWTYAGEPRVEAASRETHEVIDLTLSDSDSDSDVVDLIIPKPEPEIIDLTLSDSESESEHRPLKKRTLSHQNQPNKRARVDATYDREPNLQAQKVDLCFDDEVVEYRWNRRARAWKTEVGTLGNLGQFCSGNLLPRLRVHVLANADSIPILFRWDEEGKAFTGLDPVGSEEFRVSRSEMEHLLLLPEKSRRVAWCVD